MTDRLIDSASALSRFRSREGYKVKKPSTVSGYIAICKLRRALQREYTDQMFNDFVEKGNYSEIRKLSRADRINKFVNKLNRLPPDTIKRLFIIYQDIGFTDFVNELSLPTSTLMRTNQIAEA